MARARSRFLLDADISPEVAVVAANLGLDCISVSSIGRAILRDDDQLRLAAQDSRIFVTRNRNDFLLWTTEFIRTGQPHAGLLIVSRSIPAVRPEPLARALLRWSRLMRRQTPESIGQYFVDFLSSPGHRIKMGDPNEPRKKS